jgi:uncharacterized protein YcfL
MKNFKFFGLFAIAAFMLASCGSVAHIEKDDTVNFSKHLPGLILRKHNLIMSKSHLA